MPLESCMIIIDNSEYTRNGDYTPTRFQAQAQAVASVFSAKTDSNPESSVGLLTMAGKSPSLLVTPTNDIGRLLSSLSRAQIGGTADLITSIQIAQLALKHRENKNARQRVVVFAASPIDAPESELVKLGKKLRKNNVLIDVVLFGEEGLEAEGKVGGMIEAAGGGDSHLVTVPPGPHLLADIISTSPILFDPELAAVGGGTGGAGGGGDGDMGMDGLDPNMDPELAMAIRMSIQEEEERVRRAAAAEGGAAPSSGSGNAQASGSAGDSAPATSSTSAATPAAPGSAADLPSTQTGTLSNAYTAEAPAPGDTDVDVDAAGDAEMTGAGEGAEDEDEDEDEELRRAMALSRGEGAGEGDVDMEGEGDEDEEDEDAAIQRAIQMSLQGDGNGDKGGESK